MFAIYDVEGRRFRDTLENLRKVRESQASTKTRMWSNLAEEGTQPALAAARDDSSGMVISNKAVQAYREMRHLNRHEPLYHTYQLMSHPVHTVPEEMDILDALHHFQKLQIRQMPVISVQRKIMGMLSLEALLQLVAGDDGRTRRENGKTVADSMSREVITADPVSDIRRVAQVMLEYHLHAVPVVDERDVLVGIVSRSDILRAVMNDPPLTMWS
jgi:CBS-domain-containing membrane protein